MSAHTTNTQGKAPQKANHHQHAASALSDRAKQLAPHFQSGEPPRVLSDWWGDGPAAAFVHYRLGLGYTGFTEGKAEAAKVVLEDAEKMGEMAHALEAAGKHELAESALEWFKALMGFVSWLYFVTNEEFHREYLRLEAQ